jgi:mitochondrial inner membrane protease subunit 1
MWIVDRYGGYLSMTQGPSMMPTLNELGDIVWVDRFSVFTGLRALKRGDVIIADSPGKAESYQICKRVIALEGDAIRPAGRDFIIEVPKGHAWVEGDNPHNSVDSRSYGPLPLSLVRGRVVAKVWPPHQVGWMLPKEENEETAPGGASLTPLGAASASLSSPSVLLHSASVAFASGEHSSSSSASAADSMLPSYPADKPTHNNLLLDRMLDDELVVAHARKYLQETREQMAEAKGLQAVREAKVNPALNPSSENRVEDAATTLKEKLSSVAVRAGSSASSASSSSSLVAAQAVGRRLFDLHEEEGRKQNE